MRPACSPPTGRWASRRWRARHPPEQGRSQRSQRTSANDGRRNCEATLHDGTGAREDGETIAEADHGEVSYAHTLPEDNLAFLAEVAAGMPATRGGAGAHGGSHRAQEEAPRVLAGSRRPLALDVDDHALDPAQAQRAVALTLLCTMVAMASVYCLYKAYNALLLVARLIMFAIDSYNANAEGVEFYHRAAWGDFAPAMNITRSFTGGSN